ncbi:unnamed protein product [Zymoseptoria tritici ST99CH_3D7]|uniref:Hydrophobin n=1 Tax=Zymoseptoria tritici (strain ST99CH_3D7) TaxID=1276538 RepID=A0A1X7RL45_ZYMT9|nr:unnamed protein product [Zymoseptoria tritici ST99CH_3D7]
MQFIILAVAALAAATPARLRERAPINVCPALDSPECCQADVDGVLALTCSPPSDEVYTADGLKKDCAASELSAFCCTLPLVSFPMNK